MSQSTNDHAHKVMKLSRLKQSFEHMLEGHRLAILDYILEAIEKDINVGILCESPEQRALASAWLDTHRIQSGLVDLCDSPNDPTYFYVSADNL